MNQEHSHAHGHQHNHDHHDHHHGPAWKRLHRDWRVWLGVILMLTAMAAYVVSQDESLRPGGGAPQPQPAVSSGR
ncbi:MAG: hypothetical protein ACLP9L_36275 [Thermoguttaceae bacterium]